MRRGLLGLAAFAMLAIAACGGDDDGTEAPATSAAADPALTTASSDPITDPATDDGPSTLVWGKPVEILVFDPHTSAGAVSWQFLYLAYETLVEMGPSLEVEPGLAESWENPTPTTWVFHLREGATFSNGRAMTADDVVGSLQRVIAPETAAFWLVQLGEITSITATDDATVTIELAEPNSKLLAGLAGVSTSILPMEELAAGTFDPTVEMLGTGPYMVTDHKQDESWTFERNPYYWQPATPVYDTLEVLIIPDDAARIAALRDGRIDITQFDNPDAPLLLEGIDGVTTTVQGTTDYYAVMFNNVWEGSKLLDPRVRTAINMAIDREHIRDIALAGMGEPTAVTPSALPDACDPAALPSANGGLDEARQLLADAGAEDVSVEVIVTPALPRMAEIAQVMQQDLAEIGVDLTITQLEIGDWEDRIYVQSPGTFDAALTWYAGYGDATMVSLFWDSTRTPWAAGFLAPDPEIDAALRVAETSTVGSTERVDALQQMCELADTDAGMLPLVTKPVIVAVRSDEVNAVIQPLEGYADVFRFIGEFSPA